MPPFALTWDQLRTRTSQKWRAYPPDVLPMWVAEMDTTPLPEVVEAVARAVRDGDTGYAYGPGLPDAFRAFALRRWGWTTPDGVRVVPEVMAGVAAVLAAVTAPGGTVVISPPVYPPFRLYTEVVGRVVAHAPLRDGRLDPQALADAFAAAGPGSAYLLCHPHNPTGALHTAGELATLGRLAAEHGVRVVADEIHAPLVLDGTFVPTTTVIPDAIALHSASKAFNLAGLPSALVVPGPESDDVVRGLPTTLGHGVSHLGSIAQTAAYTHGDAWLDGLLDALRANVGLLAALLADRAPTVRWTPPEATYLAWLDLRAAAPGDEDPAARLLADGRLAVNSGASFGPGGTGYVRLNLATSAELLTEGVVRLAAAL